MANVLNNLKHVWGQASLSHRMMLTGIICGLLVVVGLLVTWSTKPDLVLLYGGLTQEDAAQISQKLRDEEIPHKVKDGGRTILAPAERIHELRLTMVAQGLPVGGNSGYSILDNDGLGISPFKEKVNFIRAISGELEKTLMVFPGVINARVMVVTPDQRLMARGRGEASASVYLKTRGGIKLKRENVLAIINLIAGAVKGVTPDKVVVVANGKLEAGQEEDELSAISGSLFDHKIQIEKYLASKAEDMLTKVLGPGKATVKVDCTLSTTTIQTSKKTFDVENKTETSIETISKSDTKNSGNGSGSLPDEKTDTIEKIKFETPFTTEQTVEGPGTITSLSVTVLADLSQPAPEQKEGEAAPETPKKMLTIAQVKTAVKNALGLKDDKNITVVDVPFQQIATLDTEEVEEPGMFSMDFILKMAKRVSLGFAVLGMLLAMKIIRGKKAKEAAAGASSGMENAEGAMAGGGGGGQQAQPTHQFKGADKALKTKISNALTNNPNQVKQLFLSWVESSQSK